MTTKTLSYQRKAVCPGVYGLLVSWMFLNLQSCDDIFHWRFIQFCFFLSYLCVSGHHKSLNNKVKMWFAAHDSIIKENKLFKPTWLCYTVYYISPPCYIMNFGCVSPHTHSIGFCLTCRINKFYNKTWLTIWSRLKISKKQNKRKHRAV